MNDARQHGAGGTQAVYATDLHTDEGGLRRDTGEGPSVRGHDRSNVRTVEVEIGDVVRAGEELVDKSVVGGDERDGAGEIDAATQVRILIVQAGVQDRHRYIAGSQLVRRPRDVRENRTHVPLQTEEQRRRWVVVAPDPGVLQRDGCYPLRNL